MRTLCAVQIAQPEKLVDAFDALYNGMWVQGKAVHKPEVFTSILSDVLGADAAKQMVAKVRST